MPLWVVATPIGNLGDITLRAIEVLKAADLVVAEDTRRTRQLLAHLGVAGKPLERLDANAGAAAIERVVERVRAGASVALVTDAGTPVVSDPGAAVVAAARGLAVAPIPGASAVTAALAVAGFGGGGFRFVGFLPRSGPPRREAIALVRATPEPVVLFESPQRIAETLADLAAVMPAREALVARELTKVHEELVRGRLDELLGEREWLGEITVVLGPAPAEAAPAPDDAEIDRRIDAALATGRRAKDIAGALALETGLPARALYERVTARRRPR